MRAAEVAPLPEFPYALWRDLVWDCDQYGRVDSGFPFPYALWRDLVWDGTYRVDVTADLGKRFHTPYGVTLFGTDAMERLVAALTFPYALWRDLVGTMVMGYGQHELSEFPYALWRDLVWDIALIDEYEAREDVFPYALWRDLVWDVAVIQRFVGVHRVSIRLVA